jgi:hypothetical protein
VSAGAAWALVGLSALVTAAIKGIGPAALGGRELPERFSRVVTLMAPALLAALVCVAAFADGDEWAIGPDTAGVAAAGLVLWRGGSIILGVVVAAAVTAGLRAL